MPDTTQLLGQPGRPVRPPQILAGRVSTNRPAPASFSDPIHVVIPGFSIDHYWTVGGWPAIHGNTLPAPGAECLLIRDDGGGDPSQQQLRCVWWDGPHT